MKDIIQNKSIFLIIFFIILGVDIYVKLYLDVIPYRYLSKPLVVLSVFIFYICNRNKVEKLKKDLLVKALLCFLLGDFFLINDANSLSFVLGMFCFIVGKFFFALRYSTNKDFKIIKLIPLLLFSFIYIVCLLNFIFNALGNFKFPVLMYYFSSQILLLMAYLRLNAVNYKSFLFVFIGVIAFVISETIVALSIFHIKMDYQDSAIMFFYGLSLLSIVLGILNEVKVEHNDYELE